MISYHNWGTLLTLTPTLFGVLQTGIRREKSHILSFFFDYASGTPTSTSMNGIEDHEFLWVRVRTDLLFYFNVNEDILKIFMET